MPRKIYDDEKLRQKATELRPKGMSYRQVAKELGCSVYKVCEILSPYESPQSRLKQVAELTNRVDELLAKVDELSNK